jgi:hypothetical protein
MYDRWAEQIAALEALNKADPTSRWTPTRTALIAFLTLMLKHIPAIASKRSMAVAFQYWLLAKQKLAADLTYNFGANSEALWMSELYTLACEKTQARLARAATDRAVDAQEAAESALRAVTAALQTAKGNNGNRGNGGDGGDGAQLSRKKARGAPTLAQPTTNCGYCQKQGRSAEVCASHSGRNCKANPRNAAQPSKDAANPAGDGITTNTKRRRDTAGGAAQGSPKGPKPAADGSPTADGGGGG